MDPLITTYTITGKRSGKIIFKYDLNGDLVEFKYQGDPLNENQRKWLYPRIAVHERQIKNWQCIKNFTVTKGEPDTSFEAFWQSYGLKSKKTRSEQLYNKLADDDKFNAIAGIRRYDNWLRQQKGMAKMLPDTYLHQKRWLDEF